MHELTYFCVTMQCSAFLYALALHRQEKDHGAFLATGKYPGIFVITFAVLDPFLVVYLPSIFAEGSLFFPKDLMFEDWVWLARGITIALGAGMFIAVYRMSTPESRKAAEDIFLNMSSYKDSLWAEYNKAVEEQDQIKASDAMDRIEKANNHALSFDGVGSAVAFATFAFFLAIKIITDSE